MYIYILIFEMGYVLWITLFVTFLAIVGLGWDNFFNGVLKGADKLGITQTVENITKNAQDSIKEIVSESSKDIINNLAEEK